MSARSARLYATYKIDTVCTATSTTPFLTRFQGLLELNRLALVTLAQGTGGNYTRASHSPRFCFRYGIRAHRSLILEPKSCKDRFIQTTVVYSVGELPTGRWNVVTHNWPQRVPDLVRLGSKKPMK